MKGSRAVGANGQNWSTMALIKAHYSVLKTGTVCSSETSVSAHKTVGFLNPEDHSFNEGFYHLGYGGE
jgi:hypothetical protein